MSAMAYRYCPDCNEWYETAEYTVDESGETVCREDDHGSVSGYIQLHRHFDTDVSLPYDNTSQAKARAREQGLI